MNVYHVRQRLRTQSIYDIELRVAYYARVSTDKEEQKNSIVNQRMHFENLIKSNRKWIFAGGYIDDGISGIHAEKREEFQRMITDARNGVFDLIITKEISRFARNTLDSIQYTRQLLSYGVCVWFQNDNINTIDDDSEFRLTIMAGVAQDEVRKLSNRVRFGHAQSIKRGVVLGNSRIYGYDKKDGKLTINPEEAEMVRLIFEKYATGDWSTPKLEQLLYDLGYRNYKGDRINRGVIQHIITNPKYKGYYVGGKVKVIDMFTKKQEFLPPEEWNMYKDDGETVPAIVDEDTWEKANKYFRIRSDTVKSRRTSFKNQNLFTGLIYCAEDGSPYWMKQHYVRGKEDVKWVCSYKIKNGASSCISFPLSECELQTMLASALAKSAQNIDSVSKKYIDIYKKVILNQVDHSSDIERMKKEIIRIKKKADKILDYNLSGAITDEEFVRRNDEFNSQISALQAKIESLTCDSHSDNDIESKINGIAGMIKQYASISAQDINRKVVEHLIEKVMVTPAGDRKAKIEFVLKNGGLWKFQYGPSAFVSCSDNMIQTTVFDEKSTDCEASPLSCSDNMMLIKLSEQHTVFYRHLRSFSRHNMPIEYTYSLVV